MTDVNNYYLGTPERIFGAKLEEGLISLTEAQELCAKKYIRPHITDENLLAAPLTEDELGAVLLKFPDLVQAPLPLRALSPMVRRMSDPDGMGATPTHQSDVQDADTDIWGAKDGHEGEIPLPVPFRDPNWNAQDRPQDLLTVEGRAFHKSRRQAKRQDGSQGSTAPVSTPTTRGPWSRDGSRVDEGELYPDEHLFMCHLKDTDNLNETPYAATTTGYPLYKGSYVTQRLTIPPGFQRNNGDHFVSFPITSPKGDTRQAQYVQVVMHPNPFIIGLRNDSEKVYTAPLYAAPIFHYDGKPVYRAQDLEVLKIGAEGEERTNCMLQRLHDPSLTAEVHRFRIMTQELARLEEAIAEGEDRWGELAAMQCRTIRRLEMADALNQIKDQDEGLVDDVLRSAGESSQRGRCA